jgi:hypothetical protein
MKVFTMVLVFIGLCLTSFKSQDYLTSPTVYLSEFGSLVKIFKEENQTFNYLALFYFLVSGPVQFSVSILFDILLVRKAKQILRSKREFVERNAPNIDRLTAVELAKIKKFKEKEKSLNKMLLFNFIIFSICRVPELLLYNSYYIIKMTQPDAMLNICFQNDICLLVADAIKYLYLLSYSLNIFFHYKFNKTFKLAFKHLFSRKKSKNII